MSIDRSWGSRGDFETPHDRLSNLLLGAAGPGELINLSSAVPNWEMPGLAAAELARVRAWAANAPLRGTPELIEALSAWLKFNFSLDRDGVGAKLTPTAGSREGLASAIATFLHVARPDKRVVLIPDGSYHAISGSVSCANGTVRYLEAGNGRRLSSALAALDRELLDSACVIIFPFPSGRSPPETLSDLRAVLDMAQEHSAAVISDECMLELYEKRRPPSFLDVARELGRFPDHLVVSSSLSKRSFVSGLRSACLVASHATTHELHKVRKHLSPAVPLPVQQASAFLWTDQQRGERIREHVSCSRQIVAQKCAGLDVSLPICGLYAWVGVDDDLAAAKAAFGAGVLAMPASYVFRLPAASRPSALRIALDGDHGRLEHGLDLLVSTLAHLGNGR